jgi:hypothetical protein
VVLNRAPTGDGGGIYNEDSGDVTLNGSLVSFNFTDNCAPAASVAGCSG